MMVVLYGPTVPCYARLSPNKSVAHAANVWMVPGMWGELFGPRWPKLKASRARKPPSVKASRVRKPYAIVLRLPEGGYRW